METPEERKRREAAARIDRAIVSRRQFLKRMGLGVMTVGAVPSLLAACGGGEETAAPPAPAEPAPAEPPPAETAAPPAEPAPPAEAPPAEAPAASGPLDYLSWEGYDMPVESVEAWKQENGVEIRATYIGNHDDIQAKIASGGAEGADLITYYQGYKPLYAELGILHAIDESKVPNLTGLFPFWLTDIGGKQFFVDSDGTRTGIPWTFGAIGITWDDAALPGGLDSWYDLLDPSLKGKVALPDDPLGSVTLAAHVLGYDPSTLTQDQLAEVEDLLGQIIAQANGISPSFGDMTTLLVSGDAVACWQGWAAMNNFAKDAGKDTIMTKVPTEGGFTFADAYAIPSTVDNLDTAHAWLNLTLDPQVNAENAVYLVAGVTVEAALPLLDEATASLYDYSDPESFFAAAPLYNAPPNESDEYVTFPEWQAKWQEIKASA
jgi:spermidine/putrescine transport system substrate-binding protein